MLSTSHEEVFKHPANSSPSKQQFSFTKSPRFPSVPRGNSPVQYDNSPPRLSAITFSIGRGARSDFTRTPSRLNPAPTDYNETGTIGSRRNMAWKANASRGLGDKPKAEIALHPGPGAYDSFDRLSIGNVGQKYSMRAKSPSKQPRFRTPGPGAYSPKEDFDSVGRYFNSKYRSSGAGLVAQARERLSLQTRVPGPGAYDPKTALSSTGEYFLTGFRNAQSRSFGKAARRRFPEVKMDTPGPGAYRESSDFGLYEHPLSPSTRHSISTSKPTATA